MSKHFKRQVRNKGKIKMSSIFIILGVIIGIVIIMKFKIIEKTILVFNPIMIQNIEINTQKNEIEIGEQIDITTNLYPTNYSKSNLQWHSTNEEIVEIIEGKIIGKSVGTTTIYLSDNEIKSNEIEIECLVKMEDVIIENIITELTLGDVYQLKTTILPKETTHKELIYESSNNEVLQVDINGNLIANSIGKSTISIKNYKNENIKSFNIEVKKIPVNEITLDDTKIKLGKGQNYIINAKVTPLEATYTDVKWTSSDNNIVTIENRKIKAINVGNAKIIATTDEGEKKAECIIEVTKNNPNNEKKFANGNYNIRSGAGTDYEILATTYRYEEIEFLQDSDEGWKKVRNSKGIVGYTKIGKNYYLEDKPVEDNGTVNTDNNTMTSYQIKNVPYINQFSLGYPTGCEAVSATMVLQYKGYNVSVKNIVDNTKTGSKKYLADDGKWYGANPFEEFVGHPTIGLSKGSYGVFAQPIVNAMSIYAGSKVKNISGCRESELLNYIKNGNPVVVWCVKNAGDLTSGVVWNFEDGSGTFQELIGEHCAVLIGYDENYVYLNDPSAGQNAKQSRSKFFSNWKKLYSQAIIIE